MTPARSTAGVADVARFEISNVGNVPLALPPRLLVPDGWAYSWVAEPSQIGPGGTRVIGLELATPATAPDGRTHLLTDPGWAAAEPIEWEVQHVAIHAEATVTPNSVLVRITNRGTADATDIEVALVEGSELVDRLLLHRVAAGGNGSAMLATGGRSFAGTVLVDTGGRYLETPSRLEVTTSSEDHAVAAPSFGASVLAALVCAMLRRRTSHGR
jgi:hypothetical protein